MPGGDYRDALRDRAGWRETPGPIVDADGERLGEHRGAPAYTVGQRKGLGVTAGDGAPRYVSRIDPLTNTIQLGRREDLETRTFGVERVSFVAEGRRRDALPGGRPDSPPRRADPGNGPTGDARRARPRRSLDRRDRRAGLGGGARPGGGVLRRRGRRGRRPDRPAGGDGRGGLRSGRQSALDARCKVCFSARCYTTHAG